MREIEWAMWANENAVISAFLILVGGVFGTIGMSELRYWQCAALAIPLSIFILLIEYPRGQRRKGNTIERSYQGFLTTVLEKCGSITRNYFIRFLIHLFISIPCCFLLPTIMGGMSLIITAFVYLVAALKGEEWKPCKKKDDVGGVDLSGGLPAPPNQPPPRRPMNDPSTSHDNGRAQIVAENRV